MFLRGKAQNIDQEPRRNTPLQIKGNKINKLKGILR